MFKTISKVYAMKSHYLAQNVDPLKNRSKNSVATLSFYQNQKKIYGWRNPKLIDRNFISSDMKLQQKSINSRHNLNKPEIKKNVKKNGQDYIYLKKNFLNSSRFLTKILQNKLASQKLLFITSTVKNLPLNSTYRITSPNIIANDKD